MGTENTLDEDRDDDSDEWYQDDLNRQCPRCKSYSWYKKDNGEHLCRQCGFYYSP